MVRWRTFANRCPKVAQSALCVLFCCAAGSADATTSLRFFGNGSNDLDRVKIRIDDPGNSDPGPPADIGADDFTVEFWMMSQVGDNTEAGQGCDGNDWIWGNIIVDRDRFGAGRAYGISIVAGNVAFGVDGTAGSNTICGTTDVRDGVWHHIAAQRRRLDGRLWLYVDGRLEAEDDGPNGDVSYPDDAIPGNFCNGPCVASDPFLVLGAEKHDVASDFTGWLDELRLSVSLRYTADFQVPAVPFTDDTMTAALYHFDEGMGDVITDSSAAPGGPSNGVRRFDGQGPAWSALTPFDGISVVQFAATTLTFSEDMTPIDVSVVRLGDDTTAVSVDYASTNGSATDGADYTPASGTLSWSAGDNAPRTITVEIVDDVDVESDETLVLTLDNAIGASLGSLVESTLTITDNDGGDNDTGAGAGGGSSSGLATSHWLLLLIMPLLARGARFRVASNRGRQLSLLQAPASSGS